MRTSDPVATPTQPPWKWRPQVTQNSWFTTLDGELQTAHWASAAEAATDPSCMWSGQWTLRIVWFINAYDFNENNSNLQKQWLNVSWSFDQFDQANLSQRLFRNFTSFSNNKTAAILLSYLLNIRNDWSIWLRLSCKNIIIIWSHWAYLWSYWIVYWSQVPDRICNLSFHLDDLVFKLCYGC